MKTSPLSNNAGNQYAAIVSLLPDAASTGTAEICACTVKDVVARYIPDWWVCLRCFRKELNSIGGFGAHLPVRKDGGRKVYLCRNRENNEACLREIEVDEEPYRACCWCGLEVQQG